MNRLALLLLSVLMWATSSVGAQQVGHAVFARGAATAQNGTDIRLLGNGTPIVEGDVLTTGRGSFAVIELDDGTRTTLRPNTVFQVEIFRQAGGDERAEFRLFKGGLRSKSGRLAQLGSNAYRVNTPVATIDLQGTDYSVRLCDTDCAEEASQVQEAKVRETLSGIGRVAFMQGSLTGTSTGGAPRAMALGASLYEGDLLETGADSFAVLVFKDESRMTLQASSRFLIERHQYRADDPEASSALVRLFNGGLRVISGLIAKQKPSAFEVITPVASITTRGTRFDVVCQGACGAQGLAQLELKHYGAARTLMTAVLDQIFPPALAAVPAGDGFFIITRGAESTVVVAYENFTEVIGADKVCFFNAATGRCQFDVDLPEDVASSLEQTPAPETIEVPEGWFETGIGTPEAGGLTVAVYDEGHASVEVAGKVLHIGQGEAIQTNGVILFNVQGGLSQLQWITADTYNLAPSEFEPSSPLQIDPQQRASFECSVP